MLPTVGGEVGGEGAVAAVFVGEGRSLSASGGPLAYRQLSPCRWGNGGPPNRGHRLRNRQHPAPDEGEKADREGRRCPAAVEVGSAFARSRVTPLYRWVASVAVGDRPLGERLSTRWKGATSAPAVAEKSPSIFWPVGWGKGGVLSSPLTWGTENTG